MCIENLITYTQILYTARLIFYMDNDYYNVLGLNRDASDKEIRSAYRRLARKHHPDVNPGDPKAEEKFKEINQAYQVLSLSLIHI